MAIPSAVIVLVLLRAERKLLLQLLDHHQLMFHLNTHLRETLGQVLYGVVRGRVTLCKILDDAVKHPVRDIHCNHSILHAAVHVARDLAEF